MADIQRPSTFPPLLRDIGVSRSYSPRGYTVQATAGVRGLINERNHSKKTDHPTALQNKANLLSLENIRKEHERELRRKKNKKAEAVLRDWELLLQRQKEHKHNLLQQRVRVQRKLISKNEQLSDELRQKVEEEMAERIESRRAAQKEVITTLRSHMQRIAEHKKQIAERLQSMDHTADGITSAQDRTETMEGDNNDGSHGSSKDNDSRSSTVNSTSTTQDAIGVNAVSIEVMWRNWRDDATRRLQPTIVHSLKLKQNASPSVKQCLEVYDQSTVHDRYTGRPIPLTEIVREVDQLKPVTKLEFKADLLSHVAQRNQERAQLLLHRKGKINPNETSGPAWYTYIESPALDNRATENTEDRDLKTPPRVPTSAKMKKQLPSFYTRDGDLLSGSIVELGESTYCIPSQRKSTKSNKAESFFLTQLQTDTKRGRTRRTESCKLPPFSTPSDPSSSHWAPLSSSALTEHNGVSEIAVKGLGHLAHGQYSLWKPHTSTGSDD